MMPQLPGAFVTTETQTMRDMARRPVPQSSEVVTVTAMQPIVIALLRGAILALVLAAINFFTCWQLGFTIQQSLVSAALLFFTTIQGRGVIEGAFDQWRAEKV